MKKLTILLTLSLIALFSASLAAHAAETMESKGKKQHPRFEECDKDKDGMLSSEEFSACFPRRADKFSLIDADKNGKVTKEEMKAFAQNRKQEKQEKFDARFKESDKDHDGALNQKEFSAAFPRLADKFSAFDADKNGKVTKEEMKAHRDARIKQYRDKKGTSKE